MNTPAIDEGGWTRLGLRFAAKNANECYVARLRARHAKTSRLSALVYGDQNPPRFRRSAAPGVQRRWTENRGTTNFRSCSVAQALCGIYVERPEEQIA